MDLMFPGRHVKLNPGHPWIAGVSVLKLRSVKRSVGLSWERLVAEKQRG